MEKVCKVLEGYVTTKFLCRLFDRSELTIIYWRRDNGLPYIEIPSDARPTVRFVLKEVLKWGKRNKKQMDLSLIDERLKDELGLNIIESESTDRKRIKSSKNSG